MGEAGRAAVAIVTAILGLAALSVVLSNNANTATVLTTSGTALSSVIQAATSPVSSSGGSLFG